MKKLQRGFTAVELAVVVVGLAAAGGWVANIVKLVHMDLMPVTGMLIVRAIGIFLAPIGCIVGYL